MIKTSNLSFTYPNAQAPAINSLELELEQGKIHCLLGANGSGKTTLLCLLAGLFNNFSGTLEILDANLPSDAQANTWQEPNLNKLEHLEKPDKSGGLTQPSKPTSRPNLAQLRQLRKLAAYVPQNPDVYLLGSTLEEDLFLGLTKKNAQAPETKERAALLLQELGLAGLEHEPLQTLSFGQRRKTCLASALLGQPQILLLDEPFAGLDWQASLHLREILITNRNLGVTQIITVHDLDLLADLADNFVLLQKGTLLASGNAQSVFPKLFAGNVRPPCWWLEGKTSPPFLS